MSTGKKTAAVTTKHASSAPEKSDSSAKKVPEKKRRGPAGDSFLSEAATRRVLLKVGVTRSNAEARALLRLVVDTVTEDVIIRHAIHRCQLRHQKTIKAGDARSGGRPLDILLV
jgi:histone H3/H4